MIFVSFTGEPYAQRLADWFQSSLARLGIEAFVYAGPYPQSPIDVIRPEIQRCNAVIAIITAPSPSVEQELTIACESDKQVYALLSSRSPVPGGFLPQRISWERFDPSDTVGLQDVADRVIERVAEVERSVAGNRVVVGLLLGGALLWLSSRGERNENTRGGELR